MRRMKKVKEKKVRVNITLDESVYIEYGLFIDNLSSFLNTTLKNYINRAKSLQEKQSDSDNNSLCNKEETTIEIIGRIMRERNLDYIDAYDVYIKEKANPHKEDLPF